MRRHAVIFWGGSEGWENIWCYWWVEKLWHSTLMILLMSDTVRYHIPKMGGWPCYSEILKYVWFSIVDYAMLFWSIVQYTWWKEIWYNYLIPVLSGGYTYWYAIFCCNYDTIGDIFCYGGMPMGEVVILIYIEESILIWLIWWEDWDRWYIRCSIETPEEMGLQ